MRMGRSTTSCFLLCLIAALGLAAQGLARAADATFPPGSRIGLVPPPGFAVGKIFRGFEDRDNKALIVFFELPAEAFAELEKSSTVEAAKKQGLAIDKREEIAIATGKAVLFSGSETADGMKVRKWLLFAPAADFTVAINVQVPEAAKDKYPESAVRTALTSLATRTVPDAERLEMLPFRVDDLANFKVAEVAENRTLVIADDPADRGAAVNGSYMIVSAAQAPAIPPEERDTFSRQALGGLTAYKEMRVTFAEPIRLGGQQGYEVRVDAKHAKTGTDVTIVQWMRFGTGAVLRIIGVAPKSKWAEDFPRFRAVRDSIAPR